MSAAGERVRVRRREPCAPGHQETSPATMLREQASEGWNVNRTLPTRAGWPAGGGGDLLVWTSNTQESGGGIGGLEGAWGLDGHGMGEGNEFDIVLCCASAHGLAGEGSCVSQAAEAAAAAAAAHWALTLARRHVVRAVCYCVCALPCVYENTRMLTRARQVLFGDMPMLDTQLPWAGIVAAAKVCLSPCPLRTTLLSSPRWYVRMHAHQMYASVKAKRTTSPR